MARIAIALLFAACSVGAAPTVDARQFVGKTFTARVVSVVDGDTVDVTAERSGRLRIRLEGVDTPERGEPFYGHAADFTRVLVFDSN